MQEILRPGDKEELDLRLHHVGYAVENITDYLAKFITPLFRPQSVSAIVEDPIQRVRVAFVQLPGGVVELVEPMGADNPIHQILKRRRGGLYHLCYATSQFDQALSRLTDGGCRALSKPTPATAFGQRRIVFLMTPYFDLIELAEAAPAAVQ
jgi:methylmalonyl-CoA/ethylmalonyl-CoA epimerase